MSQTESRVPCAADIEFDAQPRDIDESVAQLVAAREGRPINQADYLRSAAALIGSACDLAKLGGPDVLNEYVDLQCKHADGVERSIE